MMTLVDAGTMLKMMRVKRSKVVRSLQGMVIHVDADKLLLAQGVRAKLIESGKSLNPFHATILESKEVADSEHVFVDIPYSGVITVTTVKARYE